MDWSKDISDGLILKTLGSRMAELRVRQGLTQAQLATEAGVGKRTVERMEAGSSTQLGNAVRVWRVLGIIERLDLLIPAAPASPMAELQAMRQQKKRARAKAPDSKPTASSDSSWQWDEDS